MHRAKASGGRPGGRSPGPSFRAGPSAALTEMIDDQSTGSQSEIMRAHWSPGARIALFSVLVMAAARPAFGDVITMRDGRVVNGLVTYQDANTMLVRTETRVHKLHKGSIRNIRYGVSPYEARQEIGDATNRQQRLRRELALLKKRGASSSEIDERNRQLAESERKRRQYAAVLNAWRKEQARDRLKNEERAVTARTKQLEQERRALEMKVRTARAGENAEVSAAQTHQGALMRTLAFPGWGRHYLGQTQRGWFTMAGFGVLLTHYYVRREQFAEVSAFSTTDAAVALGAATTRRIELNLLYSEMRSTEKRNAQTLATRALWLVLGGYVFGVYDILSVSASPASPSPNAAAGFRSAPFVFLARKSTVAGWRFEFSF